MLAIQRQVPGELIHQQPGDEADIRPAAFDDPGRGRQRTGSVALALSLTTGRRYLSTW